MCWLENLPRAIIVAAVRMVTVVALFGVVLGAMDSFQNSAHIDIFWKIRAASWAFYFLVLGIILFKARVELIEEMLHK